MEEIVFWHNPRCSNSRNSLRLLQERGIQPTIRLYLVVNPNEATLRKVLKLLKIKAEDLIRKKEPLFQQHFKGKILDEDQWIQAMVKYPVLIQRPIVIRGRKAIISRPAETLLEWL